MRLKAPLDSPALAAFVAAIAPVNAIADAAPGFVWRLKNAYDGASPLLLFDGEALLVNMSTWRSLEALTDYVYRTGHTDVMRRRREFALPIGEAYVALWWIPRGHEPTVAEAEARLRHLRAHGPSPFAFGLKTPFAPPDRIA